MQNDLSNGHYRSLPSLIVRSKKAVFNFLKERMRKKIQDWNVKCLSRAGKSVLLRIVAQAIPSYSMFCFLLPLFVKNFSELWIVFGGGLVLVLTRASDGFREKISMAKYKGRMGFRDLHGFNLALLGKHYWNLLNNPDSLVARIYKTRYFLDTTLLKATRVGGSSFICSRML